VERNHAAHLLRSMIVQVVVCFVMLCTCDFYAPRPKRNPQNQCYGANRIRHQHHTAGVLHLRKSGNSISTMILELYFLKGTQIQMKARYASALLLCSFHHQSGILFFFSKKQVLTINCSLHVSFCSCEWSMISPLIPSTSTLATDVCLWSLRMYSLRQIRTCKYFHRD
jgi:hypothetical protein